MSSLLEAIENKSNRFAKFTDLELALMWRALITERNLTFRFNTDQGRAEQLPVLDELIRQHEMEQEKRYVARITEKVDTGK